MRIDFKETYNLKSIGILFLFFKILIQSFYVYLILNTPKSKFIIIKLTTK